VNLCRRHSRRPLDQESRITYVPAGTAYLLWHCGADGEWHFGTMTTNVIKHAPVAVVAATLISAPVSAR
jgi:hypothetical protein